MFFLILPNIGPLMHLIAASASPLYNSTLSFPRNLDNLSRSYRLTNLQVSAPSKLLIVTSNSSLSLLLAHVPSLLKSSDLRASFIALSILATLSISVRINSLLLDIWLSTLINYCITNLVDTVVRMKVKSYGYSLKNIPIPSKSRDLKCMVEKVECFKRRLRWKAYHFCK